MNAWVEQYLWNWVNGRQDNWADYLPLAEFAHNSWKHETLGKSPHELITGINPTIQIEMPQEDTVPAANDRLMEMSPPLGSIEVDGAVVVGKQQGDNVKPDPEYEGRYESQGYD